jgi:ceramide glucosyltransferase
MTSLPVKFVEYVAAFGATCATTYYLIGVWSARAFLRHVGRESRDHRFSPPISILKPLKGVDPQLYEGLRSHCRQDYPDYEIIFGVRDPQDPAVPLVRQLQAEFPQVPIRLITCSTNLGENTKVSNLAQMVISARHDHLIVNDGDIRVPADYVRQVIWPLSDSRAGLVTCLYRGIAAPTLGSRLEALGISTDFAPGVLTARILEGGLRFGLGSTLCFRRADLNAIGGFESFADYLADDYELGRRLSAQGLAVHLSRVVVETFLPRYSFRAFINHQLRWARTIRNARSAGYLGLMFTFGLPWALLALIAARGAPWAWGLLGLTMGARIWLALEVGATVMNDGQVQDLLWLLPLRDFAGVLTWLASFAGHTVIWGGERFEVKDGKLRRTVPANS